VTGWRKYDGRRKREQGRRYDDTYPAWRRFTIHPLPIQHAPMSPPVIRMVTLIFLEGVIEGFGALRSVLVLSLRTLPLTLALRIFARSGIRRRILLLGPHLAHSPLA